MVGPPRFLAIPSNACSGLRLRWAFDHLALSVIPVLSLTITTVVTSTNYTRFRSSILTANILVVYASECRLLVIQQDSLLTYWLGFGQTGLAPVGIDCRIS